MMLIDKIERAAPIFPQKLYMENKGQSFLQYSGVLSVMKPDNGNCFISILQKRVLLTNKHHNNGRHLFHSLYCVCVCVVYIYISDGKALVICLGLMRFCACL